MPLPAPEPTSKADVKAWLKIDNADVRDDQVIDLCVAAVNGLVRSLRVAQRLNTEPAPDAWTPTIKLAATMLAARLHRRRNTPGGVEAAGDFGIAYVRRNDPDIAQLLELGEYAAPGVG